MSLVLVDPAVYEPAGGPTVYVLDSFARSAGALPGQVADIGGVWANAGGTWVTDGSGAAKESVTTGHNIAFLEGVSNDFRLTVDMEFLRGSASGRWNGVLFLSDGGITSGLSIRADGTGTTPSLKLFDGTATLLETFDISGINLISTGSRMVSGNRAVLEVEYNAVTGTITPKLDGQAMTGAPTSHTLSAGNKAIFGSQTLIGLYSNDRIGASGGKWFEIKSESRTA